MEKFMLIFQGASYSDISPEEVQVRMGKWFAWIEKLNKSERYHSGEALQPGGKDVKGKNGEIVTDGPYTEGNEIVGGYFVISAKDYNEAIEMTKDYPDFDLEGTVQVRQVMNYEQ